MAERLAAYDYRALGKVLRPRLDAEGRGWRVLAAEIGVTSPDLSRICSGQPVSAPKVYAVCDWLGIDDRRFYEPPCFTGRALKQDVPASRDISRDARSGLPASPEEARRG